jgi:GPH family glycoside/pentoside/hexuronide:cation symporter
MTNDPTQRLSFWEKFGYGLGDAGCNVVFQLVMSFMAFFYTDVVGLAPAAMGTLLLIVRTVMAFADPVMGAISDRTHTRWGKFRPYLIWMSIPYAVFAVAAFATPDLSTEAKLAYAYVTCALSLVVYSAINVPYCALGGVMTPNSRERVSLNGYRFFLATAGGTMVVATTMPLVETLGAGNMRIGFPLAVGVLASLAVLMFWACFALTRERVVQAPTAETATSLWRDARLLFANDQWRVVALLNLVLFVALTIQDGVPIYYMKWYVGRTDLVGAFLTTGMLCSMVGALFAGLLTARMSKAAAYALLQVAIIVASVALFLTPRDQLVALFVIYGLQQGITQMASPILWSMMADTVDYGEVITGRRITGLTFSGALLFLKLGTAVGGALLGWLLAYFTYQPQSTTQSPAAIQGIVLLFTLVPALGHFLIIGLVSRYRLNHERCEQIQTELGRRHSGASSSSSEA